MKSVDGCQTVINVSGEQAVGRRWTSKTERLIFASRIDATNHLVAAMERSAARPAVFLCASASGYYGNRGEERLTEEASAGNDVLANLCAQWEQSALAAEAAGVRVVCMRLGVVLHASGGVLKTLLPIFRAGLGGPLGNGRQGFPWIHRGDLEDIVEFLLKHEAIRGPVNVVAPEAVSNRQFATMLGRVLKRPAVIPAPAIALKLLFGKGADGLLHGSKPVPDILQKAGYRFRYSSLRSALEAELL